jgi:nucleotide-binding universal stress UspA family protein
MTTRRIVVGISGELADEPALAWAIREAATAAAALVIAHACSFGLEDDGDARSRHPGIASAIEVAQRELGGERVTVRVQPPPSGAMLLGLAGPDDLLVVGPPSRGRWTHWGSTTQYVARNAPCPVAVVRLSLGRAAATFAGHVVIGIDGSAAAAAATGFGFRYAFEHGLPVAAVTVLDSEPAGLRLLAEQLEPWRERYPGVWVERGVFSGQSGDGLMRAAAGAVLLAIGTHAGRLGRRIPLGSTSLDAISRATCPVAILPAPMEATELSPARQEAQHV